MKRLIVILLTIMFVCAYILWNETHAATVWTQQSGIYNYYKVGPTGTPRYLISTDTETVTSSWVKQAGEYIKCTSAGGANRYWPVGYDCTGKQIAPPPPPDPINAACAAEFVCHPDWGWIVDLSYLKAQGCEHVKITKEQALFYDGLRSVNGQPVCVVWPKP